MKSSFNKFFAILLLSVFAIASGAALVNYHEGENEKADRYTVVALCAILIPAVKAQAMTHTLGIKNYFSEMDVNPLTRVEKELWDHIVANGTEETKKALRQGTLRIETYARFLRFIQPISQGGRRELLNATSAYKAGRIPQEFHQAQLPQGTNIAISHLRLGFATDGSVTVPEGDVDYTSVTDSWPAALRNAQLVISQSGAVKGGNLDCAAMGSKAASFGSAVETDGLELQRPLILEEGKPILIELLCPDGITFAATPANQFIELALYGAWVRKTK